MDLRLLVLPVVGGLIGWLTNYLAVRMLFRPRNPVRLPWLVIQGLVPRRRTELARSVGEVVERELISHDDIKSVLSDEDFIFSLRPRLEAGIDAFIRERVVGRSVWLKAAFSSSPAATLKQRLADEVMAMLPGLIGDVAVNLKDRLRFRELVEAKIEAFELDRLEGIVVRVAGRELKAIEILGGVIGFVIGLVQMTLLWLI